MIKNQKDYKDLLEFLRDLKRSNFSNEEKRKSLLKQGFSAHDFGLISSEKEDKIEVMAFPSFSHSFYLIYFLDKIPYARILSLDFAQKKRKELEKRWEAATKNPVHPIYSLD